MATIADYLTWRGDLSFAERPFNTVDNIVLSMFAYTPLHDVVPADASESVLLCDAVRRLLEHRPHGQVLGNEAFLLKLAASRRFGPALLHSAQDRFDRHQAMQFAALTICLPAGGGTYVAFRGTDSSLAGWREDFLLGSRVTGAQRMAARYLLLTMARGWNGPLYVGGHSKGGNLALYASLACPHSLRDRIARVFNNDGPGLAPEVLPGVSPTSLGSRLVRLVPQFCLVGALFDHPHIPRRIVRSNAQGALQHDANTWLVGTSAPLFANDLLPRCKQLSTAICAWIAAMNVAEREQVVQEMFDVLAAGGATEIHEVFATPSRTAAVIRALHASSDLTKRAVKRLLAATGQSLLLPLRT